MLGGSFTEVGNYYEVTGTSITKYYYAGSQRIAMRKNGVLNYIIGDHLGSTSLVTDASGNIINQTQYKAWGEERYSSGAKQTGYGYTGQYSYANDFGLLFYNARFYDPSLSRFTSADSIIPGGVQGYDRYAYAYNSPVNYVDPSGHRPCGDGEAIDCNGETNSSGGPADPLGCGYQCALVDIQNASLDERLAWVQWLRGNMDQNIRPGAGDWFRNIATVVAGFSITGQDGNQWALDVDATILYELQQGYAGFLGGQGDGLTNGGTERFNFFTLLDKPETSKQDLIKQWGAAEFAATNDGLWEHGLPDLFSDDMGFLGIGTVYRVSQFTLCAGFNCAKKWGGFFDPRSTFSQVFGGSYNNMSPVAAALVPIYFGDYLNTR